MSAKPVWAQWARRADLLARRALMLEEMSARRRCQALDSAGSQCTADGDVDHAHRYHEEDLP